jgi:hypothetical protein
MPPQVQGPGSGSSPIVQQAPAGVDNTKSSDQEKKPIEQPKDAPKIQPEPYRASNKEASNRKAELSTQATAQRATLFSIWEEKKAKDDKAIELAKKANAEVMKAVNEAKAIAVANQAIAVTHKASVDVMRASLENSDTKNLKKTITESEKWPQQNREILNEAMGNSEVVMKKVAKEFTPNEQLKIVERSFDTNNQTADAAEKHKTAVKAWMDNTKGSTLNHVVSNSSHYLEFEIAEQVKDRDLGNFNKLNSGNKVNVAGMVIGDSRSPERAIRETFENINPKEKNMLMDKIQVSNPDSQLFMMQQTSKALDHEVMEGMDKNNAEFMRKTYKYMGENSKTQDEKELYNKNAMYVENWMDEKFKR